MSNANNVQIRRCASPNCKIIVYLNMSYLSLDGDTTTVFCSKKCQDRYVEWKAQRELNRKLENPVCDEEVYLNWRNSIPPDTD